MKNGLALRELVKIEGFNPRLVWGSCSLLLVQSAKPKDTGTSYGAASDPLIVDTAVVLVGEQVLNTFVRPGSVVVPLRKSRESALSEKSFELGRSPDCDVAFNDSSVSRKHAVLLAPTERGAPWAIKDLNSTNGTWVGPVMLEPGEWYQVSWGTEIRLGHLRCVFLGPDEVESVVSYARDALKNHELEEGEWGEDEDNSGVEDTHDDWKVRPEPLP